MRSQFYYITHKEQIGEFTRFAENLPEEFIAIFCCPTN